VVGPLVFQVDLQPDQGLGSHPLRGDCRRGRANRVVGGLEGVEVAPVALVLEEQARRRVHTARLDPLRLARAEGRDSQPLEGAGIEEGLGDLVDAEPPDQRGRDPDGAVEPFARLLVDLVQRAAADRVVG